MKIRFMGTAAAEGLPALFCRCETCVKARALGGQNIRKTTCTMIDDNILIDFGPDILSHVHKNRLDITALDAIIITHSHDDHLYTGDLNLARRPFGYFEREDKIKVCGSQRIADMLSSGIMGGSAFEFYTARRFEPFTVGGYKIHPLLAEHGDKDEDCFIYAIESGGKTFLCGNDTNIFPEETWEYISGLKFDAAALDTTTGVNPPKPPGTSGHMDITAVKGVKSRMIKIGCADQDTIFIMNHFSHNGALMHHEFEVLGRDMGFMTAYDGCLLEI